MAAAAEFDLTSLKLRPGDGKRVQLEVDPGPLGGAAGGREAAERPLTVRLEVSRTTTGYALHLQFSCEVVGECSRCLEGARQGLDVDAREVEDLASEDEELSSPYVRDEVLDVGSWVHDAIVLGLPGQILCRPDCKGLCAVCGVSLNDADPAEHEHGGGGDPRFEKLRELLD